MKTKTRYKPLLAYFLSLGLSVAGGVGVLSSVGELNNYSLPRMLAQLAISLAVMIFFGAFAAEIDRRWEALKRRERAMRSSAAEAQKILKNLFENSARSTYSGLPSPTAREQMPCGEARQSKRFIKFVI